MSLPPCPHCQSEYVYEDQSLLICPECGHEWNPNEVEEEVSAKDFNGTPLVAGDKITLAKDLKVKGRSKKLKNNGIISTLRNVNLIDMDDNYTIKMTKKL